MVISAVIANGSGAAGRHRLSTALVNTIRSPGSTTRKHASRWGTNSIPSSLIEVTNAPPKRRRAVRTRHCVGAGSHHEREARGIGPCVPDVRAGGTDDPVETEIEVGVHDGS